MDILAAPKDMIFRLTIRLYRQHDLDLVGLHYNKSIHLPDVARDVLASYVRQERYYIKTPEPIELPDDIPSTIMLHINLHKVLDQDIIVWILATKEGYRNSLVKNIIRGYLAIPYLYPYFQIEDDFSQHQAFEKQTIKKFKDAGLEVASLVAERQMRSIRRPLTGEQLANIVLGTPPKEISEETLRDKNAETTEEKQVEIGPETNNTNLPETSIFRRRNEVTSQPLVSNANTQVESKPIVQDTQQTQVTQTTQEVHKADEKEFKVEEIKTEENIEKNIATTNTITQNQDRNISNNVNEVAEEPRGMEVLDEESSSAVWDILSGVIDN